MQSHFLFIRGHTRRILPLQNHGKRVEKKQQQHCVHVCILKEKQKQNKNQQLIEIVPAYE